MGKCNLSFFDHGMVVGEREADLSVTKTADLLEFSPTTVPNVDKDWHKKNIQCVTVLQVETPC